MPKIPAYSSIVEEGIKKPTNTMLCSAPNPHRLKFMKRVEQNRQSVVIFFKVLTVQFWPMVRLDLERRVSSDIYSVVLFVSLLPLTIVSTANFFFSHNGDGK